jgi:hypothetical protein
VSVAARPHERPLGRLLPLLLAGLLLAAAVAAILLVRATDPRPEGAAMRAALVAAAEGLPEEARAFPDLLSAYLVTAEGFAAAEGEFGTDPDLLDFAARIRAEAPATRDALAGLEGGAADLAETHAGLRAALVQGLDHVGTPDERFVQAVLPLQDAIAAIAALELATEPPEPLRLEAEDARLEASSAAAALRRWLAETSHSH